MSDLIKTLHVWAGDADAESEIEVLTAAADRIERLTAENARYRQVLESLAAFDDKRANKRLEETGSYSGFDEPSSVCEARYALKVIEGIER